jgi:WD40 repeat protein
VFNDNLVVVCSVKHESSVMCVAFKRTEPHLLSADRTGVVHITDTQNTVTHTKIKLHANAIYGLFVCWTDEFYVSSSDDKMVAIVPFTAPTVASASILTGHTAWVRAVIVLHDNQTIITASLDKSIKGITLCNSLIMHPALVLLMRHV